MISKGQLRLLRAIAKEKKVYNPFEANFMRKYSLTAPSSVKTALSALIDKTLILKTEDNSYHVYDRFFSIWLDNKIAFKLDIDRMVYELYGLTEEEIGIVEGNC